MIVVAGPPGSGKTRYFPVTAFGIDAFNIDDRCAQILGSYRAIPRDVRLAVAKECERFVLDHIERAQSFAVETTLRTTSAIDQAEHARECGFATEMHFVSGASDSETGRQTPKGGSASRTTPRAMCWWPGALRARWTSGVACSPAHRSAQVQAATTSS
jgi:hypothetical protein